MTEDALLAEMKALRAKVVGITHEARGILDAIGALLADTDGRPAAAG